MKLNLLVSAKIRWSVKVKRENDFAQWHVAWLEELHKCALSKHVKVEPRSLNSWFYERPSIIFTRIKFVSVIAWFVVIFGINTTSDISKLLYVNLRQFWNITCGIYAKYHVQIVLLFVYTTPRKRFVIFTRRYFKFSWNIYHHSKPIK